MKIALILPSRDRPAQALRACRSAITLATHPTGVTAFVGINEDDPQRAKYEHHLSQAPGHDIRLSVHPPSAGGPIWNSLAAQAVDEGYDYIMACSDDILFEPDLSAPRIPPWDEQIAIADAQLRLRHKDGIWMLWGWDGSCGPKHATHAFVTREWLRAVGTLHTRCCQQFDGDTFLTALAFATGRGVYLPNVRTIHASPKYGMAQYDETWDRMRPIQKEDYKIYRGPQGQKEYAQALQRLRAACDPQG